MTAPTPGPSSSPAGERLPRLTIPQMNRLVEIGAKFPKGLCSDRKPATTEALRAAKCVRQAGGRAWGTGWLVPPEFSLTPIGIRILASFPGDEFDQFRACLDTGADRDGERS